MDQIVGYLLAAIIVGLGLLVLGAIFRFGIISWWRTRGSRNVLRVPDLEGVEKVCGFPLPADLEWLYREAALVERVEFELVDKSRTPPAHWTIGSFSALTPAVAREWREISGAHGAPIADDMDKGVYFVDASGAVVLVSPNVPGNRVVVAPTVRAFAALQARDIPG